MTAYQESLRLFRKIAPFFRYFLLFYVIFSALIVPALDIRQRRVPDDAEKRYQTTITNLRLRKRGSKSVPRVLLE